MGAFNSNHVLRHREMSRIAGTIALSYVAITFGSKCLQQIIIVDTGISTVESDLFNTLVSHFCMASISMALFYYAHYLRQQNGLAHDEARIVEGLLLPDSDTAQQICNETGQIPEVYEASETGLFAEWERKSDIPGRTDHSPSAARMESATRMRSCLWAVQLAFARVLVETLDRLESLRMNEKTVQKSTLGVIFGTMITLRLVDGARATSSQWSSAVLQTFGLIALCHGRPFNYEVNLAIMWMVLRNLISGGAAASQQLLLQREADSMHLVNAVFFGGCFVINAFVYLLRILAIGSASNTPNPGLYHQGRVFEIVSSVVLGLASTFVYRYADAVLECLSGAAATALFLCTLYLLRIQAPSWEVLVGTFLILVATGVYWTDFLKRRNTGAAMHPANQQNGLVFDAGTTSSLWSNLSHATRSGLLVFVSAASLLTTLTFNLSGNVISPATVLADKIESPLRDTMAFVRWNHRQEDRIPLIQEYRPFFRTLHISMPPPECDDTFLNKTCPIPVVNNMEGDNYGRGMYIYVAMAQTMEQMLKAEKGTVMGDITSIFYFHFDAWIDPMAFATEDLNKIWYPQNTGSKWQSFEKPEDLPDWFSWNDKWKQHTKIGPAMQEIWDQLDPIHRERVTPREWSKGWSDIYAIPRSRFEDYIALSHIMFKHGILHEIAIPSMLRIIDLVRRTHESNADEVVTHLDDCWGGPGSTNPSAKAVLSHRCGHKFNLTNHTLTRLFYDRLDAHAKLLGTPVNPQSRDWVQHGSILSKPLTTSFMDDLHESGWDFDAHAAGAVSI